MAQVWAPVNVQVTLRRGSASLYAALRGTGVRPVTGNAELFMSEQSCFEEKQETVA